jgi:DNA-binding response OmpR family regulator
MGRYDRFAIVYDPSGSDLAQVSLTLLRQGIDVLFAAHADEALLLARQERERIGALLVSSRCDEAELDRIATSVVSPARKSRVAIAVVGRQPERELLRRLRDRGVDWVLWEPYEPVELRFLVAAALASGDAAEPRAGLRVPLRIAVTAVVGSLRVAATLRDVSDGGAYLTSAKPCEVGTALRIEFPLGTGHFALEATVVHRLAEGDPARPDREPGMGVQFGQLSEAQRRRLTEFIQERIRSFRL